jgi:hypothetical protein
MMHGPEGRLGPAGGKNWGMGKKRKNSAPSSGFGKRQMGNVRGYSIYVPRAAYVCAQYLTTIKPSYSTHCS